MSENINQIRKKIQEANHVANKKPEFAWQVLSEYSDNLPDDVAAHMLLGHLASKLGEVAIAIDCYAYAVASDPENPDYLAYLATAYMEQNAYSDAKGLLEKALSVDDQHYLTLANLGAVYRVLNREDQALLYLNKALEIRPNDINTLSNLAGLLLHHGSLDDALKTAQKILRINASDAYAHYTVGLVYQQLGRFDDAVDEFKKAIKLDRKMGIGYSALAGAKKYSKDDLPLIGSLEKVLKEGMHATQRYPIHFALGKMYDDIGEWDKAFSHYRQANLLASNYHAYTPPEKYLSRSKRIYTREFIEKCSQYGSQSERPVFVVGMPRSGTTLVEKIIASHPDAVGAGELVYVRNTESSLCPPGEDAAHIEKIRKNFTKEAIVDASTTYLQHLADIDADAARIVDKLPENYHFIGLIKILFPRAKIIHLMRNPLDTCLSCYFQPFLAVAWSFDLEHIARQYLAYRDFMEYWQKILPDDEILEVHYESIIENPEEESRRIINFVGLEWDDACLSFDKSDGVVRTASLWQVRQPIYKTSKMRSRHYAKYLADLANKIQKYLPDDPEVRKEFGIKKWWQRLF